MSAKAVGKNLFVAQRQQDRVLSGSPNSNARVFTSIMRGVQCSVRRLKSCIKPSRIAIYVKFQNLGADNRSPIVEASLDSPKQVSTPVASVRAIGLGIQIYADFLGYSDIA